MRLASLVAAFCLALVASACGGDTETVTLQKTVTATSPTATTPAAAEPSTQPPAAYLLCDDGSGEHSSPQVEPSTCTVFGSDGSFAGGVDLHDLKWQGWGQASATADGNECGFRAKCDAVPVRVTASRLRNGCGRKVYTLLVSTNQQGDATRARAPLCPG